MKKYLYFVFAAALVWGMGGCKQEEPVDEKPQTEPTSLPTAFVKKHLIEEFTGQDCGYCPEGMKYVHDFVDNDTNWVVILHHYGYKKDHFSVAGSKKITDKLGVSGAPNITVDRVSTKTSDGKSTYFHPGYLQDIKKSQYGDSTYVGMTLVNTYDAATRQLHVAVSGIVLKEDYPDLKLTVLVKESGMVDYQEDYYNSYEGWEEFRHVNAVRAFISEPLGDMLYVERASSDQAEPLRFHEEYDLQLDAAWVPENCMVVAFVTEEFKPLVQVDQKPVVAGTKGGADILFEGITRVPVPDYYPEPSADLSPNSFNDGQPFEITMMNAKSQSFVPGVNLWQLQGYSASPTYTILQTSCVPFIALYLFASSDNATLPLGTYEFTDSYEVGTAVAGYRDDEYFEVGGSCFYMAALSYLQQGYIVPAAQWLIADGTLTITEEGWSVTGHALNGTDILFVGTTPIQKVRQNAPALIRPLNAPEWSIRRRE